MALIVCFVNQSKAAPVSDYKVEVMVGDGTRKGSVVLYQGTVENHQRDKGWVVLLQQFIEKVQYEGRDSWGRSSLEQPTKGVTQ